MRQTMSCKADDKPPRPTRSGWKIRKGPVTAPHPCVSCGKTFALDVSPSRIATRKTCSPECNIAQRNRVDKCCRRCKRCLPYTAYRRYGMSSGRSRNCIQCETEGRLGMGNSYVMRPSALQMYNNIIRHAQQRGVQMRLSRARVTRMHKAPCDLCGKAVSCVVLIDTERDYSPDNVRKLCRTCARLCRKFSFTEVLLLAHEIARHCPL